MPTHNRAQLAIDETIVEDDELLSALIARETKRQAAHAVGLELGEADKHARALLETKLEELANADALRIGDFRVTRETSKARTVHFESKPSTRIRIEAIKPGDDD